MRRIDRILFFSLIFLSPAFAGFGSEKKSIIRTEDALVMTGKELKEMLGARLESIGLMSFESGDFQPIPFQIDQRLLNGEYAFSSGKLAASDPDPDLDENDELVFMVNDSGDRAPPGKLPAGAEPGAELEILDPVNQGTGWVYLFRFSEKAPRSGLDYVRFEISAKDNHKRVYGRDALGNGVIMGSPLDAIYPDEFRVIFPEGRMGADLLDRQKIRGVLKAKLGFDIDFKFDVLTRMKLTAWIDGPVRVIYRADGYLQLGFFQFSGTGYSLITYYRNSMIWPMYIEIPFSLGPFLKDFELKGYMDYNQNVIGHWVYSESNPSPRKIFLDGKTGAEEKNLDFQSECNWIAGYGPLGATINRLIFPPEWAMVKKRFYLKEDLSSKAPPEDDPGEIAVGYEFDNFVKVLALKSTYYQYYYFLTRLEPGGEKPILDILDHPLEVQARDFR